jgi:hypothetical protein
MISLKQIATPTMPREKVTMSRQILSPYGEKKPMIPPMMITKLKAMMSHILTLIPIPPRDHARE